MIRTTPFHARIEALNETGLWSHWAGHLVAEKYQMSEKFEYFAIRNSVGIFDTSPLYKYRVVGPDAERYLSDVMARDIRACRPGRAQYTLWCDDAGYVLEDGVVLRLSDDEFLLTAAGPNLAYLSGLVGRLRVEITDVSDEYAALALQGPRSREILAGLDPDIDSLGYFGVTPAKVGDSSVIVSRTGFTGDLGYEVWVPVDDALAVWDTIVEAATPHGIVAFGQIALLMARIEAGLVLIDVDFQSSRFAWTEAEKTTPAELGFGWMFKDLGEDRPFIGRDAIRSELAEKTSRWKLTGLVVDWKEWDQRYGAAGLVPPKDHLPVQEDMMLYDDEGGRAGWVSSFMYSPMLQRHIALGRVRPDLSSVGSRVELEVTIDHQYHTVGAHVARLPLFNPARKTS
ncbi:aminomethyltransferase family protein [soil metagenome]